MMIKKMVKYSLVILFSVFLGVGIWLYHPHAEPPAATDLSAAANAYDVEVIRDSWGVPHIYGKRNADVAFAVAYVNAQDDLETMLETIAATRGVLARYRGKAAATTDYLVAWMDVHGTVARRYERDVPADVKAYVKAYADGLNVFASQYPEKIWPGLAPFTEQDVIAGFVFKTPFFYGLDKTLLELFGDERETRIALTPSDQAAAWTATSEPQAEVGSNAIAVAPHRSGDQKTRLLINSHQPMSGPVAWWEAHLVSEEGMNMTGGLFAATPIVLHGFNQHLAWANTVSEQDLVDVYPLSVNPSNKSQYRLDGQWLDFEERSVTIKVKLWGPFAYPAKRKVLHSRHGPVIQSKHGTYAVRYAGMGEIRQFEQYYRLNHTSNLDEFMQVMSMNALPSINYVYADKDGRTALIHNGQYPDRNPAWDWSADMPGDTSAVIWQGYRPFSQVPRLIDPKSGVLYNANNTVFISTDGDDNLKPEDFPTSMGLQTNQTNRAMRLQELLPEFSVIGRQELEAIKFDTQYSDRSKAAKVVSTVLAHDWKDEDKYKSAVAHLKKWDRNMRADSRTAALGGLTVLPKVTQKYTGIKAPAPIDAFRNAVDYLLKHHGRLDVPWGEVNRLVRGDFDFPVDGGSDILRAIYPKELGDDGRLIANAGDTWMAIVEWDQNGEMSADVVHQFGSSYSDQYSKHYNDQAVLFVQKKWRPALRERAAIELDAICRYRLGKHASDVDLQRKCG